MNHSSNHLKTFMIKTCLFTAICMAVLSLFPGLNWSAASEKEGRHFIILVQDSGLMKGHQENIKRHLPKLLFDKDSLIIREFQPGKDIISLFSFALYLQEGNKYSPLPENMFKADNRRIAINVKDENTFQAYLEGWIDRLSFDGFLAPIETSRICILDLINDEIDTFFSETIVVTVTNELYNLPVSPSAELSRLGRDNWYKDSRGNYGHPIKKDFDVISKLSKDVSKYFYFSPLSEASEKGDVKTTYFHFRKIEPISISPDSLLTYSKNVELERTAISHKEIKISPKMQAGADLLIRADDRLKPMTISWGFQNDSGTVWKIGNTLLPNKYEKQLMLAEKNDQISIPLFDSVIIPTSLNFKEPGKLFFKVKFRFNTHGIYDHIVMETREHEIRLTPVKPVSVPKGGFGGLFGDNPAMDFINSAFGFKGIEISNRELAALWEESDGSAGLSQEKAKERILIQRSRISSILLISLAGLLLLLVIQGVRFLYRRPFRPKLIWKPSAPVVIDLDNPANSRLLVGTVEISNQRHPVYNKVWEKRDHPTRNAEFTFSYSNLRKFGLVLNHTETLGFIIQDPEYPTSAKLDCSLQETVTHGKQVYLFLASESIRDFETDEIATDEGKTLSVPFTVDMAFKPRNKRDLKPSELSDQFIFDLLIKPEKARKPAVEFKGSEEKLYYSYGKKLPAGDFIFTSSALHRFAVPFQGNYEVQSFNDNSPLQGRSIRLSETVVRVLPKRDRNVGLLIDCDGSIIKNPEPEKQKYQFKLIGEVDAETSRTGNHEIELYRDPTKAEIELKLIYQNVIHEIYWTANGRPKCKAHGKGKAKTENLKSDKLLFNQYKQLKFNLNKRSDIDLMRISVGNSGRSGDGFVSVTISPSLIFTGEKGMEAKNCIKLKKGWQHDDLPMILDLKSEKESSAIKVYEKAAADEGNPNPAERNVRIRTDQIERIDGAIISDKNCSVRLKLDIQVQPDRGEASRRKLEVEFPLYLEQKPGKNWLCIDFGTSAITAAMGSGKKDDTVLIPLQSIGQNTYKLSIGEEDPQNLEKGTAFLPSLLICDAEHRKEEPSESYMKRPEGFPGYRPASLQIGDPSFIGLPAFSHHIFEKPGRIIYSLKSWIGKSSSVISMGDMINYKSADGRDQPPSRELPTENVVESALSALIYGYLLAEPNVKDYRADRMILTYPNTFSPVHVSFFHETASKVFMKHFGIQHPDRIEMISESDAVAFYYYKMRKKENPEGEELILVYDFGAGTLDISVIQLEWEVGSNPRRIKKNGWKIKGRIGIPIAGNYIDEVLARIIDELLLDESLWNGAVSYIRPIVRKDFVYGKDSQDRTIFPFWNHLRQKKHAWDGKAPFEITIPEGADAGIITIDLDKLDSDDSIIDKPFIQADSKNLRIPVDYIAGHPEMEAFIRFVTVEIFDELFGSMHWISKEQIDTLIISGRGSLWGGLADKVHKQFPNARLYKDLQSPDIMKEAVVRGAITRQDIPFKFIDEAKNSNKLGLLRENDNTIILQDKWDKPIDLMDCPNFRFVQVMVKNPNWNEDQNSLRKYLYTDISESYDVDEYCDEDRQLKIDIEPVGSGRFVIKWRGSEAEGSISRKFSATGVPLKPAWPIGRLLLDPNPNWRKYRRTNGNN